MAKIRPDHIVLWLSKYDQNGTQITTIEDLPKNIRRLHRMGVEIEFVEDIRSYRKLLPALERFPNAIVVTADDDILYPSGWLENLLRGHEQHTDAIVCYRGTQILLDQNGLAPYKQWPEYTRRDEPSYLLFAQGGEGALYPQAVFTLKCKIGRHSCTSAQRQMTCGLKPWHSTTMCLM